MTESLALDVAGERLLLLGDRAILWPARGRLVIADLHLGKADVFRQAGIALPSGGTAHDLARITRLVRATGATSLWVLGDLLHGALVDTAWRGAWGAFRETLPSIEIVVLVGNHDRAIGEASLDLVLHRGAIVDGPFVLSHAIERSVHGFALSGHRHPVVKVPGIKRRMPCFDVTGDGIVLPAFSAFTGGWLLERPTGWVACVEGHLAPALPGLAIG